MEHPDRYSREFFAAMGRIGGKSESRRKRVSRLANLRKARKALKGRKVKRRQMSLRLGV